MTSPDVGILILRLVIGLTFAAHGAQKAFGWWDGPGPQRWRGAVEGMGFSPPGIFAALAIGNELIGGLLLAVGLLAPLAAAALVAQAIVIVGKAHWAKGFFSTKGGYEFPLAIGVTAAVIGLMGPRAVSLDAVLGVEWDPGVRLLLLALGVVVGAIVLAVPVARAERLARGGGLRRT